LKPKSWIAPAVLLLISIGFYWKLVLTRDYVWFDSPDLAYIELPRLQFQARSIHNGTFPLWDPHLWAGLPLIGQAQPGPLYPLNLLLCLLPLKDGYLRLHLVNWYFVMERFLAALFCYWLCRDLGRSRAAAVLAGCGFGFAGFVGNVTWLDVVNGGITTPLVILFLLRALRGRRPAASAALAGVCLGLAWLSGHHEIPLMVSLAVGIAWAWHFIEAWRKTGRPVWRIARQAMLCLALGGLVGAAQLWPGMEFGRLAVRWAGAPDPLHWNERVPYLVHASLSLPPRGLLGTVLPAVGRWGEASAFVGFSLLALAAAGLLSAWREKTVRWLAALGAAALLYALGALTPLHGILYALVPGLEKARAPIRAVHLFSVAVPVLAAYGLDAILGGRQAAGVTWVRRIVAGLGGLIVAVVLVFAAAGKDAPDDRVLVAGILALVVAGVLLAAEHGKLATGSGAALLIAVTLAEAYTVGTWGFPHRLDKHHNQASAGLTGDRDVAAWLRAQPRPLRVAVNDQDVAMNFGDWHGIDMLQGYLAALPENIRRLEMHTPRTQRLLGVGYRLARQPAQPGEVDAFQGATGLHVYRVPDPMPRAWVVHEAFAAANEGELRARIADPALDFHRTAVMLGRPPALEACSGGEPVEWRRFAPNHLLLSARLDCRGMLVVADTFYPGWQATVDGHPAPVVEVYGALRGVVVGPGAHTVELRYRPLSVWGGTALTVLGLLAAAIVVLRSRREPVAI